MKDYRKMFFLMLYCNFLLLGAVSNLYAVAMNEGRMPVYVEEKHSTDRHFGFSEWDSVNVPWLSDNIQIGRLHISLGDILMLLGGLFILGTSYNVLMPRFRR